MEEDAGWQNAGCQYEAVATEAPDQVKRPFRLIASDDKVSTETVHCLRTLLQEAESGKLIGLAYVSMYKQREWDYRACGEAYRNQTWSLGMLQAFAVKIAMDINNQ